MDVGAILKIISAALSLVPVAEDTVLGIKKLLANDPTVQAGMDAILAQTEETDDATLKLIADYRASLTQ